MAEGELDVDSLISRLLEGESGPAAGLRPPALPASELRGSEAPLWRSAPPVSLG
ncbi:unnamed protein product [Tetraodon nigroviridis]|uniref:(spotted green pufferfish) hypothetical protein n=1 Tax=Tetraodon nigroviridis TaxID=99883 RepID=Q4SXB3_TETNG|nr:unnamed protein product [Tetraodon nigroviridis]